MFWLPFREHPLRFPEDTKKAIMNRKILSAGIVAALVPVYLAAPGKASDEAKAPFFGRNFAHRGLHSRDKSVPENSPEAFRLAAEAGYGIELDVQLSKDGQVVVFHDDTLDRVCSVHARVEELTYSELRELSLCSTQETIPLFSDVLKIIGGRVPVICELKTCRRKKELCEKTYTLISHYSGSICIESFDPFIVKWFRFHAREIFRGQLAMPAQNYGGNMNPVMALALSRVFFNFLSRPGFIAYQLGPQPLPVRLSEMLGASRFAWTSHEPRNETENDCVIFEYYKPKQKFK